MGKICECGICGLEVRGKNSRFISGHNTLGSKQSPETILKRKTTMLKKYGVEHASQSLIIQNKQKETFIKKYGVTVPYKCKAIRDKGISTCLKKYGVENPSQIETIKEKKKETCLQNFGVDHPMQSKVIRDKSKETCIDRYGCLYANQSIEVKKRIRDTQFEHYGVDHFSKTPQGRQLYREKLIGRILAGYKDGTKFSPQKGFYEKEVFDELQKYCVYTLLEDQTFISLFPDRYIKETNSIVELYEDWHRHTWSTQHDIIRQKDLEDHLGCKFFIVWLSEWLENKEQVIEKFKLFVNEVSINGKSSTISSATATIS